MKLVFEFYRNEDNFCLLSHDKTKGFTIELDDMRLSCYRYEPCKSYSDFNVNQLKLRRNPTLPIDRSLINDYVVNKSTTNLSHYILIRGST